MNLLKRIVERHNIFEPDNGRKRTDFDPDKSGYLSWRYSMDDWAVGDLRSEERLRVKPLIFYSLLSLLVIVFVWRLSNLQIARSSEYRIQAEGNHIRSYLVEAPRGEVIDAAGNVLAGNKAQYVLQLYPYNLPRDADEQREILGQVANVLGRSEEELAELAKDGRSRGFMPVELEADINADRATELRIKLSDISAVSVVARPKRSYRDDLSLAHILGYLGRMTQDDIENHPSYPADGTIGKTGIEAVYDEDLRGSPGEERIEIDSSGYLRRFIQDTEAAMGNTVRLELVSGLQKVLLDNLRRALEETGSKSGVVIAMDPRDGGVLALVSLPDYDPNLLTGLVTQGEYQSLLNDPNKPLLNRAVSGVFPSGSTIKPFVAAGALDAGVINENTTLDTPAELKIGQWIFPDWKFHGSADVKKAIAESNNVFFYKIGGGYENFGGLGAQLLAQYLRQFGFDSKTGIDLTGEGDGLVPTPEWKEKTKKEKWYIGDTYHMAIGQGDLLVTPMEIVAATAAIANGGTLWEPHLASDILAPDGTVVRHIESVAKTRNVVSADALRIVREGMRQTITSGSAHSVFGSNFPIAVAGKTGTAQFGNEGKTHAWFTSFAPFDDPKLAITVFIEGGGEGYETAAPIAKAAYEWYAQNINAVP